MTVLHGIILGFFQGLGEFLPISSSGHLILVRSLLGIQSDDPAFKILDILMHVGTLLPVLIVFWKDWMQMLLHPIRNKTLLKLIVASVPTLVFYVLAKKVLFPQYDGFSLFDSGWFLGVSFLITALLLMLTDFVKNRRSEQYDHEPSFIQAIVMGCMQGFGLMPGISRSGSTIAGGVFAGLDRKSAAKFSFMMSAPAIAGSLLLEGKDAIEEGYLAHLAVLPTITAIIVATLVGYIAIRFMLNLISKVPMSWFALYTAILGLLVLLLQLSGNTLVPAFALPQLSSVSGAIRTHLSLL